MIDADPAFMSKLVIGLTALISLAGAVIAIVAIFRRPLPFPEEATNKFATKEDLDSFEDKTTRTWGELFDLLRQQKSAVDASFADMERGLGRIEGQLKLCPGPKICEQLANLMKG